MNTPIVNFTNTKASRFRRYSTIGFDPEVYVELVKFVHQLKTYDRKVSIGSVINSFTKFMLTLEHKITFDKPEGEPENANWTSYKVRSQHYVYLNP